MKYIIMTVILVLAMTVIKIDLTEGTIPLAAFSENETQCNEQLAVKAVPVISKEGDTVQGLLQGYPTDERISFPERMADFYQLNPHLKNQVILPGELIKIPIYSNNKECKK